MQVQVEGTDKGMLIAISILVPQGHFAFLKSRSSRPGC